MIARLWLPIQLSSKARLVAVSATIFFVGIAELDVLVVTGALTLGALALTYDQRRHGHYAYGAGTAFLWLAGQFALVGSVPDIRRFAMAGTALVLASIGLVPLVASREPASPSGEEVPLRLAASSSWVLAGLVGATVTGVWFGARPVVETALNSKEIWWWVVGWIVVWASWRQSLRESLGFAVVLAASVYFLGWSGVSIVPWAAGLSMGAAVALRLGRDGTGRDLAVGFTAVSSLVGAALVNGWSAAIGAAIAMAVWLELRLIPTPSVRSDDPLGRVRKALGTLPPYPRWYGRGKLKSDELYQRVRDRDGLTGSVLDIGCGMALGGAIKEATDSGRYLGLDVDADKLRSGALLLRVLGAEEPRTELRLADIRRRKPAESFDRVLLLDVLHYWPMEDQVELVRSAAGCLNPGGRLLVRDPVRIGDAGGEVARRERWTTFFGFNPRGHTRFLSRPEWETLFAQARVEVTSESAFADGNTLFVLALASAS